jgi:hypothetical protein
MALPGALRNEIVAIQITMTGAEQFSSCQDKENRPSHSEQSANAVAITARLPWNLRRGQSHSANGAGLRGSRLRPPGPAGIETGGFLTHTP